MKVVAGAGDNAAAAIGTGTVGNGACNISIGTSGTIFISSDTFKMDKKNALHSFAHSDGNYHLMGCMLSAASCNKWWVEDVLLTDDYKSESSNIDERQLGLNNVYYLPYLMGERAPHNDPYARSCFIGMSFDTKRNTMTQSIFEGVAFGIRDSLEAARSMGIDIKKSMICGGGAKSEMWKKIFANVLNLELTTLETEQGPGFGGAILAAVGCKEFATVKDATAKLVKIKETIKQEQEIVERYNERYKSFVKLYPALKDIFHELYK